MKAIFLIFIATFSLQSIIFPALSREHFVWGTGLATTIATTATIVHLCNKAERAASETKRAMDEIIKRTRENERLTEQLKIAETDKAKLQLSLQELTRRFDGLLEFQHKQENEYREYRIKTQATIQRLEKEIRELTNQKTRAAHDAFLECRLSRDKQVARNTMIESHLSGAIEIERDAMAYFEEIAHRATIMQREEAATELARTKHQFEEARANHEAKVTLVLNELNLLAKKQKAANEEITRLKRELEQAKKELEKTGTPGTSSFDDDGCTPPCRSYTPSPSSD